MDDRLMEGQMTEILHQIGSLSSQVAVVDSKVDGLTSQTSETAQRLYAHELLSFHSGGLYQDKEFEELKAEVRNNTRWRYALPIGLVIQTGSILGVFIWLVRGG